MDQKIEKIQVKDLPPDLLDEVIEKIKPFVIGLLRINKGTSGEEVHLLGSGTLIQMQDKYCIITAQHLANELEKFDELGLNIASYEHKVVVQTSSLRIVKIGKYDVDCMGQDLAVIILPEETIGTLKARKAFWNMAYWQQIVLSKSIDPNIGIWILCGFPYVMANTVGTSSHFDSTKRCCCLCGYTGVEKYWDKDEFDYLSLSVSYENRTDLPDTFEGVSGGGIWRAVLYRSDDGKISSSEPLFLGVAFWQTKPKNNLRSIIGHGWRSIYETIPKLMKVDS